METLSNQLDNITELELADGTVINTSDGSVKSSASTDPVDANDDQPVIKYVEVPTNQDAVQAVMHTKRKLIDLPDVPKNLSPINIVLTYELFGLDERDIALATGLTEAQVGQIQMLDVYDEMREAVVRGIFESQQEDVRRTLHEGAIGAARRVLAAVNSGNEAVALSAAKDILDRAGQRPVDVQEHRIAFENELVIVHKSRSDQRQAIDVDFEEVLKGEVS